MQIEKEIYEKYLEEVLELKRSGEVREHSYRTAFHNFLEAILPKNITIIQEPAFENITTSTGTSKGAPDFRLQINGQTIGYIETKGINTFIENLDTTKQILAYLELKPNLILCNYFNFLLLQDESLQDKSLQDESLQKDNSPNESKTKQSTPNNKTKTTKTTKTMLRANVDYIVDVPHAVETTLAKLNELFTKFLSRVPQKIATPKELAKLLAARSIFLRQYLQEELTTQEAQAEGQLYGLLINFRNNLDAELSKEDFVDSFAQMVAYSLFLAKLNMKNVNEKLTINNIEDYLQSHFGLITELTKNLRILIDSKYGNLAKNTQWIIEELLGIVNNIDYFAIAEKLSHNKQKNKVADPYIYFYEDFLTQYDKESKQNRGVYYTPPEAVSYIVKSISHILKNEFAIEDGFADPKVKTLDFATGTGTFLLEVYKEILEDIPQTSAIRNPLIKDHVLKNIYGFELLIAPYAVAHLKLSQYLQEKGYKFNASIDNTPNNSNQTQHERIQVYLTNTLSDSHPQYNHLLPALSLEGENAQNIKKSQNLLVILGNPPYNSSSQNPSKKGNKLTSIGELMESYKPSDETNIKHLDDDYIKFMRFAHSKLENQEQGVLGIIVNNSFINGLTHRKMRSKLLQDFSSIYILNLHGDARKKETTPDGEKDENVFSIMQGVCIAIFVKNKEAQKSCQVYYQDLWGKKDLKKHYLNTHNISTTTWHTLNVQSFNTAFRNTNWGRTRFADDLSFFIPTQETSLIKYGQAWVITEIFNEYNLGFSSKRDEVTIQFTDYELESVKTYFKNHDNEETRRHFNLGKDTDWSIKGADTCLTENKGSNQKILYRPFDYRYTYYHKTKGFLARPSYETNQHYLLPNIGLFFTRERRAENEFFVHSKLIDLNITGFGTYTAPLYLTKTETIILQKGYRGTTKSEYKEKRTRIGDNLSIKFKKFFIETYGTEKQKEEIKNLNITENDIKIADLKNKTKKGTTAQNTTPQGMFDNFSDKEPTAQTLKIQESCQVYYADLYGKKELEKYYLNTHNTSTTQWHTLNVQSFNTAFRNTKLGGEHFIDNLSFFIPTQETSLIKYGQAWAITEIFNEYNLGFLSKRDEVAIQFTDYELESVKNYFKSKDAEDIRRYYNLGKDGRDWQIEKASLCLTENKGSNQKILYRPFDYRYTYYHKKSKGFLAYPTYETNQHYLLPNIGLFFTRERRAENEFFVHSKLIDLNITGFGTYTAPLYLTKTEKIAVYKDYKNTILKIGDKEKRTRIGDNFTLKFKIFFIKTYGTPQQQLELQNLNINSTDFKSKTPKISPKTSISQSTMFNTTSIPTENLSQKLTKLLPSKPEDILAYIYAVMYCKPYKAKYLEYLKIDFPRIAFTSKQTTFKAMVKLGKELMQLHLLEITNNNLKIELQTNKHQNPENTPQNTIEKANYNALENRLYINKSTYFSNISPEVYNYQIGNKKVLEKWLNYRKGRPLELQDIKHIYHTANALQQTIEIEKQIENTFTEEYF